MPPPQKKFANTVDHCRSITCIEIMTNYTSFWWDRSHFRFRLEWMSSSSLQSGSVPTTHLLALYLTDKPIVSRSKALLWEINSTPNYWHITWPLSGCTIQYIQRIKFGTGSLSGRRAAISNALLKCLPRSQSLALSLPRYLNTYPLFKI